MGRFFLRAGQLAATILFIMNVQHSRDMPWFSWFVPLLLLLLVIVNSIWFSRGTSWVIFAAAFSCFLIVLSAFTLRWRLEPQFNPRPFYGAIFMYVTLVYVSLGQIKLLGSAQ